MSTKQKSTPLGDDKDVKKKKKPLTEDGAEPAEDDDAPPKAASSDEDVVVPKEEEVELDDDALPDDKEILGFGDDEEDLGSMKGKIRLGNRDVDEPSEYLEELDDDEEEAMDGGD
ncbi:MAG: hypothetical protein A2542_03920 [Parcubacteria group bacterium RIFOXYD2_FULL_52_8]|nr:MAG: hypothetical protein A2542_03920 [Parcubacteria group bacterium RIFOXYD2_FULL_52_8]